MEVSSKSDVPTMLTTTVNSFVEKKILVGFDNVQKTILNATFRDVETVTYTSELDKLTCDFIQVVLCNSMFDSEQFSALRPLILESILIQ